MSEKVVGERKRHIGRKAVGILALLLLSHTVSTDYQPITPTVKVAADAPKVKGTGLIVMNANVHGWIDPADGSSNLDRFLTMLDTEKPDVACVEEVYGKRFDALKRIAMAGYNFIFAPTKYSPGKGPYGNLVVSKYSVRLDSVVRLPAYHSDLAYEPRNAITFTLQNENRLNNTEMIASHVSHLAAENALQLSALDYLASLVPSTTPNALCSDTNAQAAAMRKTKLGSRFGLSNFANEPFTFAHHKLDYVAYINPTIDCVDGYADPLEHTYDFGSDHRALISAFDINNCRAALTGQQSFDAVRVWL